MPDLHTTAFVFLYTMSYDYSDYNDTSYLEYPPLPSDGNITVDVVQTSDGVLCPEHEQEDMVHVEDITYWIRYK